MPITSDSASLLEDSASGAGLGGLGDLLRSSGFGLGVEGAAGLFKTAAQKKAAEEKAAELKALLESIRGISPTGESTLEKGYASLAKLFDSTEYSKEAAGKDSKEAVDSIFNSNLERSLPKIFSEQLSGGAYNSTTSQLLGNDAYARASGEAAKLKLDTVSNYSQNRARELEPLLKLLGLDIESQKSPNAAKSSYISGNQRGAAGAAGADNGLGEIGDLIKIGTSLASFF